MKSIVILISGRGSNMEAIVRAAIPGVRIAAIVSNRPMAAGLQFAADHGLHTEVVDHTSFESRDQFDRALAEIIDRHAPDLVVLAGFMRVLTDAFVRHYEGRLINIHPSLLPSFGGLATHRRAIESGVRFHGATVHYVTPSLDDGPIVIQAAVPVLPDDTEETLAERVLIEEHRIYPQAVRWITEGRVSLENGRAVVRAAPAVNAVTNPALECS